MATINTPRIALLNEITETTTLRIALLAAITESSTHRIPLNDPDS